MIHVFINLLGITKMKNLSPTGFLGNQLKKEKSSYVTHVIMFLDFHFKNIFGKTIAFVDCFYLLDNLQIKYGIEFESPLSYLVVYLRKNIKPPYIFRTYTLILLLQYHLYRRYMMITKSTTLKRKTLIPLCI